MNIFVLDEDIERSAEYHNDKHVVKMILELTQILCTVNHKSGLAAPYKPTHSHHPCVKWTGTSIENWRYLRWLVFCLNEEYKYRFNHTKNHKAFEVAINLREPAIPDIPRTPFVLAMPEECYDPCPVKAYRTYYQKHKQHLAKWTKRAAPPWWRTNNDQEIITTIPISISTKDIVPMDRVY